MENPRTPESLSKSDSLLDDRPYLVSFYLSVPFLVSVFGLRYCLGCFPPCLLMMRTVELHDS